MASAAGTDAASWNAGWWALARRSPSPNFGPRPANTSVSLAVVHSISLPPGEYGGDAVERLFTNQLDWNAHPYYERIRGIAVSAHFFIRRDGEMVQFVSCNERAWHAGATSWRNRPDCNDYSIGIELEGLEGETFDGPQYDALTRVLVAAASRYPLQQVVGHEHIAPSRKIDPGPGFDWHALQAALAWPKAMFAPLA